MRRRTLFLLGTLLVVLATFLGRDLFREHVAPELLYTAWQAYVLVDTIPQIILWGILIALLIALAVRSLSHDRDPVPPDTPGNAHRPGRIGDLARSLRLMDSSGYVRQQTVRELDRLAVDTLSQGSRRARAEIEKAWAGGDVPVDPAVREFLAPARRRERIFEPSPALDTGRFPPLHHLRRQIATWFKQWRSNQSAKTLDPRLEQTVRFLEQAIDE